MKRCPTCNRTYTDDQMSNCAHHGAPLMYAAYSPQQGAPQPQQYPPPPQQQGYQAQGSAGWQQNYPQNYPPTGYTPQDYQQQAGWQATGTGEYVPCPRCRRPDPQKVNFTWWGGVLGPRILKHVKCNGCGFAYNGKSGQSNTTNIIAYSVVLGLIALAVGFMLFAR
jgi:transposase-like protein